MPTTVQVTEETRRLLNKLKREMGLTSYDQVIRKLANSRGGIPESLFGVCKGSLPFEREEETEHGL